VFQDRLVQVGPRLLLQSLLILCTPESVRVYPAFGEAPLLVTMDFITKLLPPQRDHVAGARLKHGCVSLERSEAVKSQPSSGLNSPGLHSRIGSGLMVLPSMYVLGRGCIENATLICWTKLVCSTEENVPRAS
jgi:hypothetical protein